MGPARTTKRSAKRKVDIATALGLDLAPQPRGQWQGMFLHTTSASNESYFMRAAIGMAGGALEGDARISPDAKDERFVEADVCGEIDGRDISFSVWVRTREKAEPFTCTARLDARARLMRGEWRHPCYSGEGCSCEGGGGIFELRLVQA